MSEQLREKARKLAARPYTIGILRDDSDSQQPLYVALNPELEGCIAQGESIQEAEANLDEFRIDYIEHLLKHNLPVPYPEPMATITTGTDVPPLLFVASPDSEDSIPLPLSNNEAVPYETPSRTLDISQLSIPA